MAWTSSSAMTIRGFERQSAKRFTEAAWQRCYVHFLRNALDHLPRKADDECMTELRWIYDRRTIEEARQDLAAWLKKWGKRYQKLCDWVEANIEETLTFYRLPRQHHKNLKSTNYARATEGGDQAANVGGADLPECGSLPTAGPRSWLWRCTKTGSRRLDT